jgi:hypothetical protein
MTATRSRTTGRPARWMRWPAAITVGTAILMSGGIALAATQAALGPNTDRPDSTNLEVTASVGGADLYPGFTGGDLHFTIVNSSVEAITFDHVTTNSIVSTDAVHCSPDNVAVLSRTDVSIVAPAHSSTDVRLSDVVTMLRSAPDGCQGVSFTIGVSLVPAVSDKV